MPSILVIIPTYCEKSNIAALTQEILQLYKNAHVLVVDDSSPDGTADAVKQLQQTNTDRVHLIERRDHFGFRQSYVAGLYWGVKHKYDYLVQMDADFTHEPRDISKLLGHKEDVIIASRYVKGGGVVGWSLKKKLISHLASLFARSLIHTGVKDLTSGFKLYKRQVIELVDLEKLQMNNHIFQIELIFKLHLKGANFKEVPVILKNRKRGESKLDKKSLLRAVFNVLKLRMLQIFGRI